jgi:peptidoglycan/LPS O-acetylase OafA/YrhL
VTANAAPTRERLYGLDALRGIAALTIVVHHWYFFSGKGTPEAAMRASSLPFEGLLQVIYIYGYLAVDLFFGISGFVFFWLYGGDVAARRTSATAFAIRRLSRLYPLHLLTLVVVAAGQLTMFRLTGEYLAYEWNDLRHFVLNLFMGSSWGFERDMSFNGPAWSVSVEVALYAAFFIFCRWLPRRAWLMLAVAFASRLVFRGYFPLGRGLWSFFIGCAIAQWYADVMKRPPDERRNNWIVGGTLVLWIATVWSAWPGVLTQEAISALTRTADPSRAAAVLQSLGHNWVRTVLFPATIVSVLILDRRFGVRLRALETLGQISYGTYLWHFPLILFVVLASVRLGINRAVFESPLFMLVFLCVLVAWSLLSFRRFERPMQTWIRARVNAS